MAYIEPKIKAKEIYNSFYPNCDDEFINKTDACLNCCDVMIDAIIYELESHRDISSNDEFMINVFNDSIRYWQEVKHETKYV